MRVRVLESHTVGSKNVGVSAIDVGMNTVCLRQKSGDTYARGWKGKWNQKRGSLGSDEPQRA